MQRKRQSLRDRKQALKEKKGRRPRFPKLQPKGELIYRNPEAVPVSPVIKERGQRVPFRLENVEWISINSLLTKGGHGVIYLGKIKFKGKASTQAAVIKRFKQSMGPRTSLPLSRLVPEIINRVKASKVPCPKMEYLKVGANEYIVMEPFIRSEQGAIATKFKSRGDLVRELDLSLPDDMRAFKDMVRYVGQLSKAGLEFRYGLDSVGLRVDVFNWITLKSGKKKVFVQDLDTLYLNSNTKDAWESSTRGLIDVVSARSWMGLSDLRKIAERIVAKVAEEMGLSNN